MATEDSPTIIIMEVVLTDLFIDHCPLVVVEDTGNGMTEAQVSSIQVTTVYKYVSRVNVIECTTDVILS